MAADVVIKKDTGEVIATGVSFEEYLEKYAGDFCELVEGGTVVRMSPVHERHDELTRYLAMLLIAYFALRPIGRIRQAPFVQRLPNIIPHREPDIMVILNDNPHPLKETYMDGPADICIEVLSPGSEDVDRGKKFTEYEKGGVPEYWIFDPMRREALFYRLVEGVYIRQSENGDGDYQTSVLPDFVLHVPTLWQIPLPDFYTVGDSVKAMLG